MERPNAIVEYVDDQGAVVFVDRFYDPGLDRESAYTRDWMKRSNRDFWTHLAYGCGKALNT